MANNDDNPRRNRDRLEDGPFIAFRRFADSQVSSLMNTLFTLPATIANYNNVHQAREACLFSKADKAQCEKLREIEDGIAKLRNEGRELYQVGDLQEVLKKSEELMRLDRHAEDLRKEIVGGNSHTSSERGDADLVQKVANRKGQEWGWDWSWGFPKPFDEDDQLPASRHAREKDVRQRFENPQALLQQIRADGREIFGEEAFDQAVNQVERVLDEHPFLRGMMGEKAFDEFRRMMKTDAAEQRSEEQAWRALPDNRSRNFERYSPRALDANEDMRKTGVNWREAYEDLMRSDQADAGSNTCPVRRRGAYPRRVPWMDEQTDDEQTDDEPSYEYSHDHEDQHDDPPTPKISQSAFAAASAGLRRPDACDVAWKDEDINRFLQEQQEKKGRYLGLRECPRSELTSEERADISKYLHEEQLKNAQNVGLTDCPRPGTSSQDREDIGRFLEEQQGNGKHLSMRHCPRPDTTSQDQEDISRYLEQQHKNGNGLGFRDPAQSDEAAYDDDNAAETELDAYEHVLAKAQPPAQPQSRQPSILSTLTTTERSVAPDGSVTTKVVLRKRFADGREESSETVHTQRGQEQSEARDPWAALQKSFAPADEAKRGELAKKEETKKSGWFWSS